MQLRCVELTEFTPPPPKSLVEPHTRVLWVGAIRCLWGVRARVIAHTEIYLDSEVVEFLHLRSGTVSSVCAYVLVRAEWDGSAADTDGERFSESRVVRESRDSAHDCQSRELRSHPTHAGVVTICTVPEMLPETWTRGDDVRQDGFVLLSCHFSQRLSIRTRTPPCPSPSPSSPPCASPPSRSRAATLPPG